MSQGENKIDEILREAATAVEDSGVPEDLREVAFAKAVDLISGASMKTEAGLLSEQRNSSCGDDILEMISRKFEADIGLIEEAYEVEDGVPQLTVARSKLASSKMAATKQVALLLAAARQAAGVEDWTEFDKIRESVEMYGKYNSPNFARTIAELEDEFSFSGKGQSKRVKVRRDGFKSAGSLIGQLLGKHEK